ncbi:NAD(P)-dependent oxidoreductase [Corynebacterium glyciniphilum]|uniref:NAD(P)-dependent oxidoreductase n=1 Tax=Corynebacterium glyciniphilum TaxID=1404244 RepID=UPI0011AB5DF6|nr:NAD(P)H-binding protein [Corynebacterium glyciniphilum]
MTSILVLGATGRTGSAVLSNLPPDVTTIVALRAPEDGARLPALKKPPARVRVDINDEISLRNALDTVEVVVNAIRLRGNIPTDGLVTLHDRILAAGRQARGKAPRIVTVGGAGALRLPGGHRFWESPTFPHTTLPRGRAHAALRDHLETAHTGGEWAYLIPPPTYDPDGAATGRWERSVPGPDESAFTRRAVSYADFGAAVADAATDNLNGTRLIAWPTPTRKS